MPNDYEVGYKRPPRSSQWAKGQSGNPRGRARGVHNFKSELNEELGEKLRIKEQGVAKKITKRRAVIKAVTAKAVQGDTRAATVVLNMMLRLLHPELTETPAADLAQEDRDILEALIARRLTTGHQGGKN